MAGALLFVGVVPASADNPEQSVGAAGTTTIALSGGTASTDITYWIFANNAGGNPGCDAADGSSATLTVAASPAGLTLDNPGTAAPNDSTMNFTACGSASSGQQRTMRFTATSPGTWNVTATIADAAGQYNVNTARFTIVVTAPVNTAPTVAVTGVSNGASYELGVVPAAGCQVTDTEDGSSTAVASLSPVAGPLSAYDIGSRTATCTHTDSGGLSAAPVSATYTVVDTTAPALTLPSGQVLEATSASGAEATWTAPTATDLGTLAPGSPSCDYASGATFPLGTTTVSCSASDRSGNTSNGTFTIDVLDTTAPVISGGSGATLEATGPTTLVNYAEPTASDAVSGAITPACVPPSGSGFPVGDTTVTCTAGDGAGNSSSVELHVIVTDTTGPAIDVPNLDAVEATGPGGAAVSFTVTASDLVDGATTVDCDYASGDTFPLGTTLVTCTSEDTRDNLTSASFTVEVVDTTAPDLSVPANMTVEATGPSGATVTFSASASDIVDGDVTADCIPASGSVFALGETTVTCTATDAAGNTGSNSFTVSVVDTTAPALTLPADIVTTATSAAGASATYVASATDLVDGSLPVTCTPASGSTFAPGITTVSCSAADAHGNTSTGTFTVTVTFAWNGFFAPVDNNGVVNTIKGGQSVPLKWNIPNGSGGWISSLDVVTSVTQAKTTCSTSAPTDEIEAPTSGSTSLRYDSTANQYIYNWQSPKGAGTCYKVTVYLTDGTSRSALFKTK